MEIGIHIYRKIEGITQIKPYYIASSFINA
jgi:hypothetical protein